MAVNKWFDKRGTLRWKVEFESDGARVFRRMPRGATEEQGKKLEARLRRELVDITVLDVKPDPLLRTTIDLWLAESVKGRKAEDQTTSHANNVVDLMAGHPYTVTEFMKVAELIRGQPLAARTRNKRLCILKAAIKHAWVKGRIAENLSGRIQLINPPKFQREDPTPEQVKALIEAAPTPRAAALMAMSAYTGMRLGEVCKFNPATHLKFDGAAILVKDPKNGRDRYVPVLPELAPHLAQFPFKAGWRNVYRGFETAREDSGVDVRFDALRHFVGTALTNAGVDLRLIAEILGHTSIQTTTLYTRPNLEVKLAALEAALGGLRGDNAPIKIPSRKPSEREKLRKSLKLLVGREGLEPSTNGLKVRPVTGLGAESPVKSVLTGAQESPLAPPEPITRPITQEVK